MPDVDIRPMTHGDLPRLARWLGQPHVQPWWMSPTDLATVEAEYGPCLDGRDPTELFVVTERDRPVGMIQRYLISDDPEWARALPDSVDTTNAAGLDYLIGEPDAVARGVGSAAVSAIVPATYERWPVTSIVVAVQQANRPSWRVLERAGFQRVWAGQLHSTDPSDAGPAFVYVHRRS